MSYNFHITRVESFAEDGYPITLEEIEEKFNGILPDNFNVERSGMVTITTPRGEKLEVNEGAYIFYQEGENEGSRINLFFNKQGPSFCVDNNIKMIPIIEFAESLGAKVQGDEGEFYTKKGLLKEFKSKNKKSIFKRLFAKKAEE